MPRSGKTASSHVDGAVIPPGPHFASCRVAPPHPIGGTLPMPRRFTHSFGTLFGVLLATSSAIAIVRAQVSDDDLRDHIAYHLETNAMVKKYDITVKVDHHDVI